MWNSPNKESKAGKRYPFQDLAVLVYPLGIILDLLDSSKVEDVVDETILHSMTEEEFVYSLYEVFQALLEEKPIPKKGHPGYQEALVTELLNQTHDHIVLELDEQDMDSARKAAWTSFRRLCFETNGESTNMPLIFEDLNLDLDAPSIYLSEKLSKEIWRELLLGESYLWSEFLWDEDWRLGVFLDIPESATKTVTEMVGIDLEVVHQLPHSPNRAEYRMALHYLKYLVWKDEAL
ncbi:MAG: hypothetical protein O7C75_21310 [Verrucomicrobia bacterium]|nr:hypothetical protein [Verrucomicrobiota bacterium]